jgi:hypothetical protein
MSRRNLYLWSLLLDLFWNNIIFVLLRFTLRAQVWQNLCRRSTVCDAVGPPWLGTEAPDYQHIVDIWLQFLVEGGQVLQIVLVPAPIPLYILYVEEGGDQAASLSHPWPCGKKCLCFLPILSAQFVYMDLIMLHVLPPTLLSVNFYSRPSCQIESKAFLISTKHEKTLPLFWSIRVCRVNTWSFVR